MRVILIYPIHYIWVCFLVSFLWVQMIYTYKLFNPKCSSLAKKHLNIGQNSDSVPDVPGTYAKRFTTIESRSQEWHESLPDIFGPGKAASEESSAKDYSPASASDLSLLSALKLADDVRLQQDSQRAEGSFAGIFFCGENDPKKLNLLYNKIHVYISGFIHSKGHLKVAVDLEAKEPLRGFRHREDFVCEGKKVLKFLTGYMMVLY